MQIVKTNNSHSYGIKAIFRDGEIYNEGQVSVIVQKEGTLDIKTFTPAFIDYRPNYAVLTINLTDEPSAYEWKDGESYMIKVIDYRSYLLYMDNVYVTEGNFDAKKQNIQNDDYISNEDNMTLEQLEQNEIDNDYIILDN